MNITTQEIERLAVLSKLSLSPAEIEDLKPSMSKIIGYIEQIKEVDLSQVKPTTNISFSSAYFRPDEVSPQTLSKEEVFRNAPEVSGNYFSIPKTFS